jgi:AcrR family transcriptional regulator
LPTDQSVGYGALVTTSNSILNAMRELTMTTGTLPSMDAVAQEVGLSKGGLIHHFPSRAALVDGLITRAIAEVDAAMTRAAAEHHAAETWLRLSVPEAADVDLYRAMAVALKALGSSDRSLPAVVTESLTRWDALLTAELGDASRALTVRLVGDGLFMNALSGMPIEVENLNQMIAYLLPATS